MCVYPSTVYGSTGGLYIQHSADDGMYTNRTKYCTREVLRGLVSAIAATLKLIRQQPAASPQ